MEWDLGSGKNRDKFFKQPWKCAIDGYEDGNSMEYLMIVNIWSTSGILVLTDILLQG